MTALHLSFGLKFEDLYSQSGLAKLDATFIQDLSMHQTELHNQLVAVRANPESLEPKDASKLIVELAPHVQDFIGKLFGLQKELVKLAGRHSRLSPIYACKRLFVQRRAIRAYKPTEVENVDGLALEKELETLFSEPFGERTYAAHVMNWLEDETSHKEQLDLAAKYGAWAVHTEKGRERNQKGILFKTPKKLDFEHLVPVETAVIDGVTVQRLPDHDLRRREGFSLTDAGADLQHALDEANYCIFCHNQGKDSCSKGYKDKKTGEYQKSATNVIQTGCPLEEHISEMNFLKSEGHSVAALAAATINNPMCAGTGHRICNDCMKGCIYQKQEPVNIPQIETRSLKDVLALPWGFEIYSLLTRWNPLNFKRPIPKPDTGYKVLVVGLGPAGYTLTHHLLNDGHTVVSVDGLKIEPLPAEISGIKATGERIPFQPIKNAEVLFESLDERVLAGFGGVAEYGITVRWNKNYLKIIRLLLERRDHFRMFGGVRFGGTLTYDKAFELGFDHIALAAGAGKPTLVDMPNRLVRGVRTASDFLMALQLTGAAKKDSITNLQLRLPVLVIGGGLTGIDTATESLAYYPVQVEKFLTRYETLCAERGEANVRSVWTEEETKIADEFISHAKTIRAERILAQQQKREPELVKLMNQWGGARLVYRRRLSDAPSYRLNHEEVELAMQEGIGFIENATPQEIVLDEYGHAKGMRVKISHEVDGVREMEEKILPARTIIMAAGTNPNTTLQREDGAHFHLDGKYFQTVDEDGNHVEPEWLAKPEKPYVLSSINKDGKAVSFFGDLHPSFAGNVVKAMGSAKQGYPVVSRILQKAKPNSNMAPAEFLEKINGLLRPIVHEVKRLTPTIVEVVVKAPLAAEAFHPGQFYRLQNFESLAQKVTDVKGNRTILAMEGLALTGAWVDKDKGLLSMIVLEMGGSADLCAYLKPGEPVIVMGPTGTPTETPGGETVMLIGGGLGNAVLFSIGKALRAAGSKVLYIAGYKKLIDRYKVKEIEEAADEIVWCCDEGTFQPDRPQDKTFHGNIVQATLAYANGELGTPNIDTKTVDRIVCIGSDRMMAAIGQARHTVLKDYLKPGHEAIGSINSPMQCMMKEICAQCLQKHIDPATGEEYYVYSCFNQDQPLDNVDFQHLNERLRQNTVQEKLTSQWIDRTLKALELRKEAA